MCKVRQEELEAAAAQMDDMVAAYDMEEPH